MTDEEIEHVCGLLHNISTPIQIEDKALAAITALRHDKEVWKQYQNDLRAQLDAAEARVAELEKQLAVAMAIVAGAQAAHDAEQKHRARVAALEDALREIDSHIYNDNGDVTWSPLKISVAIRALLTPSSPSRPEEK